MPSENGWNPARVNGATDCEWVRIPGAEHVSLQFLKGWPLIVLRAYAADYHAYIEPLRDADSASYTPTNSVATSNHLNGTAMDLNWNSHPFQVDYAGFDTAKIARMRELLAFYNFEGLQIMFWAQDWRSPKDAMHHQMGYGTWNNPIVGRFIAQRIRADGFSTFRRGNAPMAGDPAFILSQATGLSLSRATEILPTMVDGLKRAECTNANRIAMFIAQTGHESANFTRTEEYASGAAYEGRCSDLGNCQPGDGVRFKGRTWIQVTGRSHYAEFSKWAYGRGLVSTPTYFVDHPVELQDLKWAGIGAAWYWTVARPMNALTDAGASASWGSYRGFAAVTAAINGGTNGLEERRTRYNRALALGDQLLTLTTPSNPVDPTEELLTMKIQSISPYANPGEPPVEGGAMIATVDLVAHRGLTEEDAADGDPEAIYRLARTAAGKGPNPTPARIRRATRKLAEIEATNPEFIRAALAQKGA